MYYNWKWVINRRTVENPEESIVELFEVINLTKPLRRNQYVKTNCLFTFL